MRAIGWVTLSATVALAGCGDGDGLLGPGSGVKATSYRAEVSGDVRTRVNGQALFGSWIDDRQQVLFGVEMAETGAGESLIQIVRLGGQVPAEGSYRIVDALNGDPQNGDFVAVAFDSDNGQPAAVFVGTSGTLKVTSSSPTAFKGTFTFDAEGGLFNDPETTLHITVAGSFYATPAAAGLRLEMVRSR